MELRRDIIEQRQIEENICYYNCSNLCGKKVFVGISQVLIKKIHNESFKSVTKQTEDAEKKSDKKNCLIS